MGYGSRSDVVFRIELSEYDGSENWVDIKARRSLADREAVQMAGLKIGSGQTSIRIPGSDMTLPADFSDFDFGKARVVRFERAIVAWSLKADDGDALPMPLTEDVFREQLDAGVADWLTEQIETYYQQRRPSPAAFLRSNGASTAP